MELKVNKTNPQRRNKMIIETREQDIQLGRFGIEIEYYNVEKNQLAAALNVAGIDCHVEGYNHRTRPHWKIVTDASVRGRYASELVSPILNGEDGLRQIDVVCEVLNRLGAKVNGSCGLHVHHDAARFSQQHLINIVKFYRRSEKEIDAAMPRSRRENNNYYTRSTQDIVDALRNGAPLNSVPRYSKVNLQSYFRHGTVEFRQHSGTTEAKKIKSWVILTLLIAHNGGAKKTRTTSAWNAGEFRWYLGISRNASQVAKDAWSFFRSRQRHFGDLQTA
jgi:hypothetical protein